MNQSWKNTAARFLTAQTISLFGSSLVQYAIVWYITLSTSSGRMLTISTVCGFAPQIAISLFAGVWIDRYDRKSLIMLSDTIIALSTLILAIAFFSGHRNIWLLFTVLMVRSAGTGIQTPAVNACTAEASDAGKRHPEHLNIPYHVPFTGSQRRHTVRVHIGDNAVHRCIYCAHRCGHHLCPDHPRV